MIPIEIDPEREERDLERYLGDAFDRSRLVRYEEQLDEEFERLGDEATMYRTSEGYLYNLTAFAMTKTKVPYLETLVSETEAGSRLLDFGCGIGSDGLALIEAGYDVSFADFDNPSTRYLKWRLEDRGLSADVFDLDSGLPAAGFDLAYAFDVIEHVDDPFGFLSDMEEVAGKVLVNFLEPEPDETSLHHELPIRKLLAHAARNEVVSYRVHYGRSHLVLYSSSPASLGDRLRSRARILRGRVASARLR